MGKQPRYEWDGDTLRPVKRNPLHDWQEDYIPSPEDGKVVKHTECVEVTGPVEIEVGRCESFPPPPGHPWYDQCRRITEDGIYNLSPVESRPVSDDAPEVTDEDYTDPSDPVELPKMGRPSKYDPSMCQTAIEFARDGATYTEIAVMLGISRDTLYRWMDEHDDFSDAMKTARMLAMTWWERRMRHMAMTGKGNAAAAIFSMKNQFPDDYKDKREQEMSGTVGVHEIDFTGYTTDADEDEDADAAEGTGGQ